MRTRRGGVAGEWAIDERLSLIVERNRAAGFWTSRAGVRFNFPARRANRKLKSAVRALPGCRAPVGLGANRVTTSGSMRTV